MPSREKWAGHRAARAKHFYRCQEFTQATANSNKQQTKTGPTATSATPATIHFGH